MLFVTALTSLFVLLAISINNRCWHNTSYVYTFCGLCTNTGIHRSSTGIVFALVTQNIQTPWTISLSFRFQNAFVCGLAAVYNRGKLLIFMIKERQVSISVKRNFPLKSVIFRWNLSTENYITRPFDPWTYSAFFLMWKPDLVDPLARATQCLATTGDG